MIKAPGHRATGWAIVDRASLHEVYLKYAKIPEMASNNQTSGYVIVKDAEPKSKGDIRQERFISHALVEIRKYRWLPFGIHSAVLLDISLQGFKIEFTGEYLATVGDFYWLHIPLAPLGIYSPARLTCQTQCRWFDEQKYRVGGVFMDLDKTQRLIIDQIIETLKMKGYGGV